MDPIAAAVLAALMLGGVAMWLMKDGKKRKAEVAEIEAALAGTEFVFKPRDDAAHAGFVVSPFVYGTRHTSTEVLMSKDGAFKSFTYRWNASTSKKAEQGLRVGTYKTGLRMPAVMLEADAAMSGLKNAAVNGNADMERAAFNATWTVHAEDDSVAESLLTPTLIARLLLDDLYGRTVFFDNGVVGLMDYAVANDKIVPHALTMQRALGDVAALIPEPVRRRYS